MRVLVIDSRPLMRRGIRAGLEEHVAPLSVQEAGDEAEALRLLDSLSFDLVILDLYLEGSGSFLLLERALARDPGLRFLITCGPAEAPLVERAYRLGAKGYLPSTARPEILAEAARRILAGGSYVAPELAGEVLALLGRSAKERLSDRELDVLRLIGEGRSLKHIALDLGLSPKTISTHKARMMKKLRLSSNLELLAHAREWRWGPLPAPPEEDSLEA